MARPPKDWISKGVPFRRPQEVPLGKTKGVSFGSPKGVPFGKPKNHRDSSVFFSFPGKIANLYGEGQRKYPLGC